ncbi:MAG: hypothetical protein Q7S65_03110 [Nanoarchaeota archaeon]|nr:hypothetical protein [Nanoarchaeota archaeon]
MPPEYATPGRTTELKNITLSLAQLRLYKERAVREYRFKREGALKEYVYSTLISKLRKIAPLNIVIGMLSAIYLVRMKGVESLVYLFLSALIGLTLIPYITQLFIKKAG